MGMHLSGIMSVSQIDFAARQIKCLAIITHYKTCGLETKSLKQITTQQRDLSAGECNDFLTQSKLNILLG